MQTIRSDTSLAIVLANLHNGTHDLYPKGRSPEWVNYRIPCPLHFCPFCVRFGILCPDWASLGKFRLEGQLRPKTLFGASTKFGLYVNSIVRLAANI